MLLLVFAHGDQVRLIDENVRRHQNRIREKTGGDVVRVLLRLHLELRHARKLAELRVAAEHPGKLCVRRNMRLDEHDVLLRVQTAGDILRELLEASSAKIRRNLPHGNCVHVHDAVQTVILVLQRHPVFDCAHIRAQRQIAARLNA